MTDTLSSQIYLSRDSIRQQISDRAKVYLELENVDLTKSSFLSFMIDTVSTLTANLLFYQLSAYREFFLTKAQLPESILNLSAFLGYNTREATAAAVNVLITIPFGFDDPITQFVIADGFEFTADGQIPFETYYTTTIQVVNNSQVTITVQEENLRFTLPVSTTTEDFSFVLPLRQQVELVQELQIDADTLPFQFVTLDVPIDGQVAALQVQIREPGDAGYSVWTEFDSLFLMDDTDEGYVSRRTDVGRRLTFGNNLVGVQPAPGSSVLVTVQVTQGEDGNVIPGSIRTGERIYLTTLAGLTQIVDYTVVNNSAGYNGEDEESLEEIRRNSIDALTALNRLVTENDYKVINVIVADSPLAQNALPVLKRSDLQVNEISLFSGILFGTNADPIENLVPTRNAVYTLPAGTAEISRDEVITIAGVDYQSVFEIRINELNSVGYYDYIIYEVELIPAIETSYPGTTYDIYSDKLEVIKDGDNGVFKLYYKTTESDAEFATCEMEVTSSGSIKTMTNDSTGGYFIYTFTPYTNIPIGEQTYEFTISDPSANKVVKYSNKVTFRSDLSNFMRSNVLSDSTSITVYDVPVIKSDYYAGIDKRAFELEVMQKLISTMDLADYRMLTDFSNTKFTNTYGPLLNMLYNEPTLSNVVDIVQTLPTSCQVDDRFILTECNSENPYENYIAKCIDATALIFTYSKPISDSIVYVENKGEKYIYSSKGWIPLPIYTCPLEIEIEVFRSSTYSGTLSSLISTVQETIYDAFSERFGTNIEIYRSEIIDVVQGIDGVSHCSLVKPETSIFFNFQLKDLTQEQLLRYGPEYVFFLQDDIVVRVA